MEMTDKDVDRLSSKIRCCLSRKRHGYPPGSAAVLVPLICKDGELHVLYELRSSSLTVQPSEVCFPGGSMDPGETPEETAVRETMEELLLEQSQIEILGELDMTMGPSGAPLFSFVGMLRDYKETFSEEEVDHTFTIPVSWLQENPPEVHKTKLVSEIPEDFPYELIPGGREYPWRKKQYNVMFYRGTDPQLWGLTARVTSQFIRQLSDN